MSLQTKITVAKELIGLYKKWPELLKPYASFRDERIRLYESPDSKLPSGSTLVLRAAAVKDIGDDVNFDKFPVTDRLKTPDGNPNYYKTIMREASKENQKFGVWQGVKATTFGWFK